MAILKHIASKNADYGEAQRYLMFQYDESANKPILNENGELISRKEYYMDGINCDPFTFDMECRELNALYRKNESYDEIKSHHYIISFDPKDAEENGLTGEQAQQLGLEYARNNFPGHQALVCTHTDGHNESGNIHVHIVINSLRKLNVERQDFMERPCDSRAGYKHHVSKDFLIHLKKSLMDMCRREHLHQVDLLTPADRKVTEKEYWTKQRGQKNMDKRNKQMLADGVTPRKTKFQTQKDYLRDSIEATADIAKSQKEFEQILLEKYNIKLKISRGRFSYLHPERTKPVTGKSLGTHYEKDWISRLIEENSKAENTKVQAATPIQSVENTDLPTRELLSPSNEDLISILFIKSDLRLVVNLQKCIKAQQNTAYANKIKLSNLKEMAKTVAYIQEHGYDTRDALEDSFSEVKSHASNSKKALKAIEDRLRQTNEQIHYTGQYLANKPVYQQFCKSKNKGQFWKEHSVEIALYEAARKFLKEHSAGRKLPSMKLLKAEKEQLLQQKKAAQKTYHYYRDYKKELNTVCSNVNAILDQTHSRRAEKQRSTDIS